MKICLGHSERLRWLLLFESDCGVILAGKYEILV